MTIPEKRRKYSEKRCLENPVCVGMNVCVDSYKTCLPLIVNQFSAIPLHTRAESWGKWPGKLLGEKWVWARVQKLAAYIPNFRELRVEGFEAMEFYANPWILTAVMPAVARGAPRADTGFMVVQQEREGHRAPAGSWHLQHPSHRESSRYLTESSQRPDEAGNLVIQVTRQNCNDEGIHLCAHCHAYFFPETDSYHLG